MSSKCTKRSTNGAKVNAKRFEVLVEKASPGRKTTTTAAAAAVGSPSDVAATGTSRSAAEDEGFVSELVTLLKDRNTRIAVDKLSALLASDHWKGLVRRSAGVSEVDKAAAACKRVAAALSHTPSEAVSYAPPPPRTPPAVSPITGQPTVRTVHHAAGGPAVDTSANSRFAPVPAPSVTAALKKKGKKTLPSTTDVPKMLWDAEARWPTMDGDGDGAGYGPDSLPFSTRPGTTGTSRPGLAVEQQRRKDLIAQQSKSSSAVVVNALGRDPLGRTVGHWAARKHGVPIVSLFIGMIPLVDVLVDVEGSTLLHYVAGATEPCTTDDRSECVSVTRLLLKAGASPQTLNARGDTPTGMAEVEKRDALLKLFEKMMRGRQRSIQEMGRQQVDSEEDEDVDFAMTMADKVEERQNRPAVAAVSKLRQRLQDEKIKVEQTRVEHRQAALGVVKENALLRTKVRQLSGELKKTQDHLVAERRATGTVKRDLQASRQEVAQLREELRKMQRGNPQQGGGGGGGGHSTFLSSVSATSTPTRSPTPQSASSSRSPSPRPSSSASSSPSRKSTPINNIPEPLAAGNVEETSAPASEEEDYPSATTASAPQQHDPEAEAAAAVTTTHNNDATAGSSTSDSFQLLDDSDPDY